MIPVLPAMILVLAGVLMAELTFVLFALLSAAMVVRLRGRIPYSAIGFVAPLFVLIAIGLVFSLQNPQTEAFKDLWYIARIILAGFSGVCLGLAGGLDRKWLGWIAAAAFVLAVYNVARSGLGLEIGSGRAVSYFAIFAAPFIWRYYRLNGVADLVMRLVLVVLVLFMIYASGSRAALLVLLVSGMAAYGVLHTRAKLMLGATSALVLFYLIFPLLPQYDFQNITFLGKVQNSLNEIAFETGDDRTSMYANWRGFEAYRGFVTWLDANFAQKIVGLGWGAHIDLGRLVYYGEGPIDSLPAAHNGYFTVLVKTGVSGLTAFLYFLIQPARRQWQVTDRNGQMLSQMLRGGSICLIVTTVMISGPLNKGNLDGVVFMWALTLGALLHLERKTIRSHQPVGRASGGQARHPAAA